MQRSAEGRLGSHLKHLREERKLTLGKVEKLSAENGERINKAYLFRVERGRALPTLGRLQVLAIVYRVKVKTLVEVLETGAEEQLRGERLSEDLTGESLETLSKRGAEAMAAREFDKAALIYRAAWEQALRTPPSHEQNERVGQARHDFVTALRFARRWDLAREEAEAALEQPGLTDLILDKLRVDLAMIYWRLGHPSLSREIFNRLLARSEEVTPEILAVTQHDLGSMLLLMGHPKDAAIHYRKSLSVQRQRGDRSGISKLYHNIGLAELEAGNYSRASKSFRKAIETGKKLNMGWTIAASYNGLARIHFEKGAHTKARSAFREAIELARVGNYFDQLFSGHYFLRRIALAEGDQREAHSYEASLRFFASRLEEPLSELEEYRRERPAESLPDFPHTYQVFFHRPAPESSRG